MKPLNLFIAATIALAGAAASADQKSEKGRVDDCYTALIEVGHQLNDAGGDDPELAGQFMRKRQTCNDLRVKYVKAYGAYQIPGQRAPAKKGASDER